MGTEESVLPKSARAPEKAGAAIRLDVRRILLDRVEQYRVNPRLQLGIAAKYYFGSGGPSHGDKNSGRLCHNSLTIRLRTR
jgi:hypothetical protein